MAIDLSSTARPSSGVYTYRAAMDATAGDVTSILFPEWCRSYDVQFKQSDDTTDTSGELHWAGTDGAAGDSHFFEIPSGQAYPITICGRGRVLGGATHYLACGANGGYAHMTLKV